MVSEFTAFPKIARLSREIIIQEKIDGTNAQIYITEIKVDETIYLPVLAMIGNLAIVAGCRTRWISPGKHTDNYGFAQWVKENAEELIKLGPGRHFGEWWGLGIQRNYGLKEKRFSLFRVPKDGVVPACCSVVPVLGQFGEFSSVYINDVLRYLTYNGSVAAPGFMKPEGIVIYHTAAGVMFKKTIEGDEKPKSALAEEART